MLPEHHIPKNLVYSGSRENVRLTMIGGRILYKDGEYFIGESADSIIQKCEVRAKRIFASL
jgi:5-methylthioadenosine/S-adenosylhomocysteine deaminase